MKTFDWKLFFLLCATYPADRSLLSLVTLIIFDQKDAL